MLGLGFGLRVWKQDLGLGGRFCSKALGYVSRGCKVMFRVQGGGRGRLFLDL
jgi:hypothetical protein